jgi:hypothetical protein
MVLPDPIFSVWLWYLFAVDDSTALREINSIRIKQPDDAHKYNSLIKVIIVSISMALPFDICTALATHGVARDTVAYTDGYH